MKSFLVVSTAFAPENAIGAVRVSKLAKYLVRMGHEVTVISPELAVDTPLDLSLECEELSIVRRYKVPQGRAFNACVAGQRRNLLAGGNAAELVSTGAGSTVFGRAKAVLFRHVRFAYSLIRSVDWHRQVVRFVREHPEIGRFDVVLSSYPSLGGMLASATLRRAGIAARWIADFRDPMNYRTGAGALIYQCNTWIQRRLLGQADEVVAISHGVAAKLEDGGGRPAVVVYNGFDPEDFPPSESEAYPRVSADGLQLCYAGSLYGGTRDVSIVFFALSRLVEAGSLSLSEIIFAYAGTDFAALQAQARRYGMESILIDHGRLPRQRALGLLASSDIAVVATWNTHEEQGIMTGKLFECFMVRTPVLGVVNGNLAGSEFARVVEAVGAGFVYEDSAPDPDIALAGLSGFLLQHRAGRAGADPAVQGYRDSVADFSYPRLAGVISSLA